MPPDPNAEPELEAMAWAWDITPSSWKACWARTEERMVRKLRLAEKVSGAVVGGIVVV